MGRSRRQSKFLNQEKKRIKCQISPQSCSNHPEPQQRHRKAPRSFLAGNGSKVGTRSTAFDRSGTRVSEIGAAAKAIDFPLI